MHEKIGCFMLKYFICIKRSDLHPLNLTNLPNLYNIYKTHLLRVWRVIPKWIGECRQVWPVLPKWIGECRLVWQVLQNGLANVGESGESCKFPKKVILASASTCQKWIFFVGYLHMLNLGTSSHCLEKTL